MRNHDISLQTTVYRANASYAHARLNEEWRHMQNSSLNYEVVETKLRDMEHKSSPYYSPIKE
mgnify:CR=1 FL=1